MPRGREYYDPILQVPGKVEGAPTRRIELYPEQDVRDNAVTLRWMARLIDDDGKIIQKSDGSFDHDDALRQAQELWPGLEVFELREESEDSTWDGMGPSPRLWQGAHISAIERQGTRIEYTTPPPDLASVPTPALEIRAIVVGEPGPYVFVQDVVTLLENYAVQYDEQSNPSGALALREAAAALKEPF